MPLYGRYVSSGMVTTYHYIWRWLSNATPTPSDVVNFMFRFRYWFR